MTDLIDESPRLLDQALNTMRDLLGEGWKVEQLPQPDGLSGHQAAINARVQLAPPGGASPYTELLVIVRRTLAPRDVAVQLRPVRDIMRHSNSRQALLVVSPWLSPRTQEQMRMHDIAYLDLTGNASISITYPAIRIYTHGATRVPRNLSAEPAAPRTVTLAGSRAGRIVRFLADFAPPYQAKHIADATDVSLPWVSRLLGQLEDQLLIRREGRVITEVKWPDLLRARAESYDLLRHNPYVGAVSLNGIRSVLADLRELWQTAEAPSPVAVTGAVAAQKIAPLVVGGQLMLYVDPESNTTDKWIEALGLLPDDHGADVLLLRAHDPVVYERTRKIDGVPHVALSQLVLDELAGPGRMPAEAEQLLTHLTGDEPAWRHPWSRDRS